jgi:hypothetical protein
VLCWLGIADHRLRALIVGSEDGFGEAPPPDILEEAVIDGQMLVPTLSLQDLEVDRVVSEDWV